MISRRELFWEEDQGLRRMTKSERMWEGLKTVPHPYLRDSVDLERELAMLDFYMMWSIEEFIEGDGALNPRSIVLLRECTRELVPLLRRLGGTSYVSYFEQLLALAREVLRRVQVREAYRIVKHDAEQEMDDYSSSQFAPPFEEETAVPIERPVSSTDPLQDSELENRKEHDDN